MRQTTSIGCCPGFFAIRRDRLLAVGDGAERFKIALEALLRSDEDFRVAEVPICFRDRSRGQSKMSKRQVASFLRRSSALAGGIITAATMRRFALVGMDKYFMASELAFYRRDGREGVEQTAGRHLFDDSGVMYVFWFPPEQQSGRVLLLVSFDPRDIEDRRIRRWFHQIGPIEEHVIHKYGRGVRYFCRVAYDYHTRPAATS